MKQRWGLVIGAGLLAEIVIIGTIMLAIVVIRTITGPTGRGMAMADSAASWTELLWGLSIFSGTVREGHAPLWIVVAAAAAKAGLVAGP